MEQLPPQGNPPSHPESLLNPPDLAELSYQLSPIEGLPVELILAIFRYCDPAIEARFTLTHTCRHWRCIASGDTSLWTNVRISITQGAGSQTFESHLHLLDTQFSRVRGHLLDVVWYGRHPHYFHPRLLHLLRSMAPFSQWRTLVLDFAEITPTPSKDAIFHSGDTFDNLESLDVHYVSSSPILKIITTTVTARLWSLEVRTGEISDSTLEQTYGTVLRRISRLLLSVPRINTATMLRLPPNIKTLLVNRRDAHEFPSITNYTLSRCSFKSQHPYDLQKMVVLVVIETIKVNDNCDVMLPTLKHLHCGAIYLGRSAKIEAPFLETLSFIDKGKTTTKSKAGHLVQTFRHPGYLLSPAYAVDVHFHLPEEGILGLLTNTPNVGQVTLQFEDEICARKVMLKFMSIVVNVAPNSGRRQRLCPKMSLLRLNLDWDDFKVKEWKARASLIVASRRGSGAIPVIHAKWRGQSVYRLLA